MSPDTPNRAPRKSKSFKLAAGRSSLGIIIKAATTMKTQVMASAKYAHGHHASCASMDENTAPMTQPVGAAAPNKASIIFFLGLAP